MGAGFQAIAGAEVAAAGGDINDVIHAMKQTQHKQSVYCGLMNVDFVRRGGRVNWAVGAMGSLLKIRPIMIVDEGLVKPHLQVRSRKAWLDKMAELMHEHAPLERLAFVHTENMEDVEALRERVADIVPEDVIITYATPSIGVHTGPRAVGFATVSKTP
jgi:DegV family protein with EDD domain